MPTVALGIEQRTLAERRFIPELTSRSLNYARAFAFLCAGIGLLTGCGSGNNDNSGGTAGSIIKGPVIGATVEITDVNGLTVASLSGGDDSQFFVDLPKDVAYPLIVTVIGGTDSITGESPPAIQLRSAILDSDQSTVNINPFTTLIVAAAEQSDQGLSIESIQSVQDVFRDHPFGLHSELAANPLETRVNEQNVAELIKASETLAEVLRRTSNSLGITVSDAIQKLAADLVDGTINGSGAPGTDPRVAVVTNTVTAQVLVESLSGTLTIMGIPFDQTLLDVAVKTMFPENTSTEQTAAIAPTDAVLKQASMATEVALAIEASPELNALRTALNDITPNREPQAEEMVAALDAQGTTPENASRAAGQATRAALTQSRDDIANANAVVLEWFPVAETGDSQPGHVADNTPPESQPEPEATPDPDPSPIPDTVPRANSDAATVEQGVSTLIDVLGNDTGLRNKPLTVKIVEPPEKGTASITGGRQIRFQSYMDTLGTDNLAYQIKDSDGDVAVGSVDITITCSSPPCDRIFSASWILVPGATGYCLYHRNIISQSHKVSFTGNPSNHPLGDNPNHRVCFDNVASFDWTLLVHTGTDIFAITSLVGDIESDFSKEATVVSF